MPVDALVPRAPQFWCGAFGTFRFWEGVFLAPLPERLFELLWEERLTWHEETMRMEQEDLQYDSGSELDATPGTESQVQTGGGAAKGQGGGIMGVDLGKGKDPAAAGLTSRAGERDEGGLERDRSRSPRNRPPDWQELMTERHPEDEPRPSPAEDRHDDTVQWRCVRCVGGCNRYVELCWELEQGRGFLCCLACGRTKGKEHYEACDVEWEDTRNRKIRRERETLGWPWRGRSRPQRAVPSEEDETGEEWQRSDRYTASDKDVCLDEMH